MRKRKNSSFESNNENMLAAPFFTVLLIMAVISFIIPLRPTESMSEKRRLAAFPDFSWSSLADGSYFDGISTWFSDTFPGRELFLSVSRGMTNTHGLNSSVVDFSQMNSSSGTDDIDDLIEQAQSAGSQATQIADNPEQTAAPSDETGAESWGGFGAEDELEMFNSAILINGYVMSKQSFSKPATDNYVGILNGFGDKMASENVRFFNVPAPTSVSVLVQQDMLEQLGCADQGKMLEYISASSNDSVVNVNSFNTLIQHNGEDLYYSSDHHWSGLGAYYAYTAFCAEAGFTPVPLSDMTEKDMGEFRGSFYYTVQQTNKVRIDDCIAYVPKGDFTVTIYEGNELGGRNGHLILDTSNSEVNMKYNCFIEGDNAITCITNNDLPDAPDCILLKDSFGNPFAVYLAQHYHNLYVLDYRKVSSTMSSFVKKYGASDVVLCQSIGVSQTFSAQTILEVLLK